MSFTEDQARAAIEGKGFRARFHIEGARYHNVLVMAADSTEAALAVANEYQLAHLDDVEVRPCDGPGSRSAWAPFRVLVDREGTRSMSFLGAD